MQTNLRILDNFCEKIFQRKFKYGVINTVFKEERSSQTKSSQVIAKSLDSSLRTLKIQTEAYVERNKLKPNLF